MRPTLAVFTAGLNCQWRATSRARFRRKDLSFSPCLLATPKERIIEVLEKIEQRFAAGGLVPEKPARSIPRGWRKSKLPREIDPQYTMDGLVGFGLMQPPPGVSAVGYKGPMVPSDPPAIPPIRLLFLVPGPWTMAD